MKNLLLIVILIVVCFFEIGFCKKCCVCKNTRQCRKKRKEECTERRAQGTLEYFKEYVKDVPQNGNASGNYECVNYALQTQEGSFRYRGCVFQNIKVCNFELKDRHKLGGFKQKCKQDENNCSAAVSMHQTKEVSRIMLIVAEVFFFIFVF